MLDIREHTLLKLQEVLRTKNYSQPVKQKIRDTLLDVCELELENKEQHILSLIEGLEQIDTFKVNTRKQLLKVDFIKNYLDSTTTGFASISSKLVAIVKGQSEKETTYHELIHLTQSSTSYLVAEEYGFSGLIQKAMKEGEAVYYEMMLQKKEFPETIEYCGISFSCHSVLYKVFYEFYQDMRNLFGDSILGKWKKGEVSENIVLEMNQYMNDHYGCDFSVIYKTWVGILYYFCSQYQNSEWKMIIDQDYEKYNQNHQTNVKHYKELLEAENKHGEYLEKQIAEIKKLTNKLHDPQALDTDFEEVLASSKKELADYIHEYGNDQVAQEWAIEISEATIEDYRNILLNQTKTIEKGMEYTKKQLKEVSEQKQPLDWLETFYFPVSEINVEDLVSFKYLLLTGLQKKDEELAKKQFLNNTLYFVSKVNPKIKSK